MPVFFLWLQMSLCFCFWQNMITFPRKCDCEINLTAVKKKKSVRQVTKPSMIVNIESLFFLSFFCLFFCLRDGRRTFQLFIMTIKEFFSCHNVSFIFSVCLILIKTEWIQKYTCFVYRTIFKVKRFFLWTLSTFSPRFRT